ncbi:hypothetical protein CAPTEDRAFT_165489 [Capitella teleta]|uniref:39S ribosomal protein L55, mitochondrial n=1 Tax=Capitella teleta TaxID=283909 RepID=R7VC54_CAPTE|nr:hypothetical protein CAPTEDRAFT_165489 [Capitella teleta]|eukprot:ELU16179.1 hypothetical protein CAPTEDRAFT_165489 [Capitella teleta]
MLSYFFLPRFSSVFKTCQQCSRSVDQVRCNSNRAAITRINRRPSTYARVYPVHLVQPDGSSFTIHYNVPRRVIKLPVDLDTLSEEERTMLIAKRKPKQKIKVEAEVEDSFDLNEYSHLWKK